MINRRGFLGTLGASAVLSAVPALGSPSESPASSTSRKRISLNGEWERYVGGSLWDVVTVPSSLHPSGIYTLKRTLVLPKLALGERAFVHFEAITYCAKLSVNGKHMGVLGPYIPYEFEFTGTAKEGNNDLEIEMADLVPFPDGTGKYEIALGVNPGWEAYGGIIRDAWVEIRPASYVDNVRLAYRLGKELQSVALAPRVTVAAHGAAAGEVECVLMRGGAKL